MDVDSYRKSTLTPEQAAEHDRVLGDLAQRTRELMDAQLRTGVDLVEAQEVAAEIEALTRRLLKQARPGPLGIEVSHGGDVRAHGNAVVGLRNPVAVPLHVERDPAGRARASFRLGALYEGPPGLVHGGVSALILDQMLGEAAGAGGKPGMTGQLSLRYRRPTPLGDLSAEAWIEESDGVKTRVRGQIKDSQGNPTVEAEGLFILPRWAREAMARQAERPARFE